MSRFFTAAAAFMLASTVNINAEYPVREPRVQPPEGCTAIVVDPEASVDGGMTTHTNDCKKCDYRLSKVPPADWKEGDKRPIFRVRLEYPKYIGDLRGETYKMANTDITPFPWKESEPIGYIPQVAHTYGYIDGLYGVLNEFQVGMGESTCAARLVALPVFDGGKALFDMSELSRVAMERSKTARQAVEIMGALAEQYGFYGAEWKGALAEGEAGEAMTISDPKESYVFHILPDDTGTSAVWIARRVPKGHIAVVANAFMIGDVDFDDHDNFLYSKNMVPIAQKLNFWQPEYGPFNFAKVYGLEVFWEIYCSRRTWRLYNLAAPSLKLSSNSTVAQLPFSVKVEGGKLSRYDMFRYQRDHYEGTEFDLTKGLPSGPYGNPNRYDRGEGGGLKISLLQQGTFERGISLYRTLMSSVTMSRAWVPNELSMMWWGAAAPHATFYSPLYAHSTLLPSPFSHGSIYHFDRTTSWWAATSIGGWMERMYVHISPDVYAEQSKVEQAASLLVDKIEKQVVDLVNSNEKDDIPEILTSFQNSHAERATQHWWWFFDRLIEKFHDGYRVDDFHVESINPVSVFYPLEWLYAVGFFKQTPDFNKTDWQYVKYPPSLPPVKSSTSLAELDTLSSSSSVEWSISAWFALVFGLMGMGIAVGILIGQKMALKQLQYLPISSNYSDRE